MGTLVLTTHSIEEAEALAPRIGILCSGRLRALGSPQHLKRAHTNRYRIQIRGPAETAGAARSLITRILPGSRCLEALGGSQGFEVAGDAVSMKLGQAFQALKQAKADLGLETCTLSKITLEEAVLKWAAEVEGSDEEAPAPKLQEVAVVA